MFKCSECGEEYSIKPDYCDCGNDVFEEIQIVKKDETEDLKEKNQPEIKVEPQVFQASATIKKQNSEISAIKKFFDPLSTSIFLVCIILSILSILFLGNPSNEETPDIQDSGIVQEEVKNDIPTIDKFWDNTAVKTETEANFEAVSTEVVKQEVIQPSVFVAPQVKQQVLQPKTTPVQTQNAPKKQISTATSAPVIKKQVQAPKKPVNKQDLERYKISLRNTLASKINFAAVVGDGNCLVTFKVNSSGTLTNRSFAKKSDNVTLNDAVYAAVMETPSFNPPPSAYNNDTMRFYVNFASGNFEVTLN